MSQGIRQPTADVSKVRECPLCGLGAVSGREMEVDSSSPGGLCQTRLQDTGYFIPDNAALLTCSHMQTDSDIILSISALKGHNFNLHIGTHNTCMLCSN